MSTEPAELADDSGRRWLTPGVRGIGAASLLSDLGHEVPTALLPSLLISTLGARPAIMGSRPPASSPCCSTPATTSPPPWPASRPGG